MNPISTVSDAITLPLKAVGVVGLCFVINWMTSPGYWWVKWVALGMGIAVVSAWWRAFRLVALTAIIAALGAGPTNIGAMRDVPVYSNGWGRSRRPAAGLIRLRAAVCRANALPAPPWVELDRRGNAAT